MLASSVKAHAVAYIDLSRIVHNCNVLRKLAGADCKLCVAVKCNAYGHSIDVVLPALYEANVDMLAVATIAEAKELRQLGWERPVLLLGSELSIYKDKQKMEQALWLVENDVRVTLMHIDDGQVLRRAARVAGKRANVHVLLDTGMCRMGLDEDGMIQLIDEIEQQSEIGIEGLYTHLATADELDKTFANLQISRLCSFHEMLNRRGVNIPMVHAANAAAVINLQDISFDMIRPGIAVYGFLPSPDLDSNLDFKPAMKIVSYLTAIKKISKGSYVGYGCTWRAERETYIGLVPIGYGDGYDRRLSNNAVMRIGEHYIPVIGRVSMDQTIIDLTSMMSAESEVFPGQEVVVIDDDPCSPNGVQSLATQLETIPYEIVTRMGPRIERLSL